MERGEFFTKGFTWLIGSALDTLTDHPALTALESCVPPNPRSHRPPGATKNFSQLCTGCDGCMIACPHHVIMIDDLERRDPLIYPDSAPCLHCDGYPCIQACPTEALTWELRLEGKESSHLPPPSQEGEAKES